MLDLGLWQTFETASNKSSSQLQLTGKPISPSAFLWQLLWHNLHIWSQSRRCGGPKSSALPQDHPSTSLASCCTAAHLQETQLGYGYPCILTTTPGNILSITLSQGRDGDEVTLQLAISISKESLKSNIQSLKNSCWLQALAFPETLAGICEARVFTLWEPELLCPTM